MWSTTLAAVFKTGRGKKQRAPWETTSVMMLRLHEGGEKWVDSAHVLKAEQLNFLKDRGDLETKRLDKVLGLNN